MIKNIQNNLECNSQDIWKVLRLSLSGAAHGPSLQQIVNIYGLAKVKKLITNYANR